MSGVADARAGCISSLAEVAERAGLRRVHILAWRDLDDPEAGGSELHSHRIASLWAAAGIDVTMRTSVAAGHPTHARRDGYKVVRKAGRYMVFPRTALSGKLGRTGPRDGLVEVWNGMPFFSPLWARCPRIVFLHHVHAEMWRMVLSPRLARLGEVIEFRIAPRVYKNARIVTLSESSRTEITQMLGLPASNISVVPPGVEPRFSPDGERSAEPLVVAVGRLVPVKRFDILIDALVEVKKLHPDLRADMVGEGYARPALEERIRSFAATDWIRLPGHLEDGEVLELYRRAWLVASASVREGWGMTLTEAGACGAPAVATAIAGHTDAVADGYSGILAKHPEDLAVHMEAVIDNDELRRRLSAGALERARSFTWEATALGTLEALAREASLGRRVGGGS